MESAFVRQAQIFVYLQSIKRVLENVDYIIGQEFQTKDLAYSVVWSLASTDITHCKVSFTLEITD